MDRHIVFLVITLWGLLILAHRYLPSFTHMLNGAGRLQGTQSGDTCPPDRVLCGPYKHIEHHFSTTGHGITHKGLE